MPQPDSYLPVLQGGRWFSQLPAEMVSALLGMAKVRVLEPGETLFLRGSPPCGLYAVVRGCIRVSGQGGSAQEAREALLIELLAPAWFGEVSVFDGSARTHDAHALGPTTVLQVPHPALLAWLQMHPGYWRNLALLMADKLRLAFVTLEEQVVLPAPARLARRLVRMAQDYGQGPARSGTRRSLALTQEQLSLMLGLSRQTINGLLSELKSQGVIQVQRGTVEILDWPALQRLCDGPVGD